MAADKPPKFTVYARAFHPLTKFKWSPIICFRGDNRGFADALSSKAKYKISAQFVIDFSSRTMGNTFTLIAMRSLTYCINIRAAKH